MGGALESEALRFGEWRDSLSRIFMRQSESLHSPNFMTSDPNAPPISQPLRQSGSLTPSGCRDLAPPG